MQLTTWSIYVLVEWSKSNEHEAHISDDVDWPGPGLVGLKQDEQRRLIVAMEELHVDDVQKLLVQLTDINDVAGQKAGFRSVDGTENMLLISQLHTWYGY